MHKILREPLVHFLILGAALFWAFDLNQETDRPGERRIVVTQEQVDQLAAQFSRTWLRPPTADELDGLVERYVRSEVHYREALAMGLGQDDPYVRNRLALKLEFLLDDLSVEAEPGDAELQDFLDGNAERFAEPARLTFRQAFVNPERHPDPNAEAQRQLAMLRAGGDPASLGDPSLLGIVFDDLDGDTVARQFGEAFAQALSALQTGGWQGPVRSAYGLHLVRVDAYQPARQPALAEIRDTVVAEWRDQRRREAREQAYQRLRERYDVVMQRDAPGTSSEAVETSAASADGRNPGAADAIAAAPERTAEGRP
jgi:hypothetical protein